jgi:hypothetical protein
LFRNAALVCALIVSSVALATNPPTVFHVADGHYQGFGSWTDNQGHSGTVTSVLDVSNFNWVETATYSDGRVIQAALTFDEQGASTYNVTVNVGGQTYVVGYGACSQDQCASSIATPSNKFIEVSSYNHFGLLRSGSFFDAATGVWTFYRIAEARK